MVLKKKNLKTVYVPIAADIIHAGHLNIINTAKKYGKVIIGLLSDKAIAEYKRLPLNNYDKRLIVMKNLKNINKIVKQETWDYEKNLLQLRPNYFIHGDDWKTGVQKKTRQKVLGILKKIKGKLIEVPYTKDISSSNIINKLNSRLDRTDSRVSLLKRLIKAKDIVRLLESHNALTGIIIEKLKIEKKNKFLEFDGMWSSSLTDSATRGKPDNQAVDFSTRFSGLSEILDVTSKPVLFDADNGGRNEHISYTIRTLERLGISGICIEDKIGIKRNSLFDNQLGSYQDSIKNFSKKINIAKNSQLTNDFVVVARIESFILGKSLNDAIKRANAYSAAGADAILIHSKEKKPYQIFKFAKNFKKSKFYKPMIAVPSTYSKTYEKELIKNGFKVVIYANQLLRAAYPQMLSTAKQILENGRAYDAEKKISSINQVLNLIK
tara:strand:+ start:1472 stop:2782 length:1311 start_codon:yes stop_codon:yes gene_type:complete